MKNILKFEELLIKSINIEKEKINEPFAVMLSGGLDSSLIAAIAKPDLALTCHIPFGEKYDEFAYAQATVKHLNLNHVVVEAKTEDFEKKLKKGILAIGNPTPHFSIYPLYILFEKAKELGITHIMRGDGADELLGGYTRNLIVKLIMDLYDVPELKNYAPLLGTLIGSPIELYSKLSNPQRSVKELKQYWTNNNDVVTNMNFIDLNLQMECQNEIVQKIAKTFDIQVHAPFLNKEMIDFCLALPPEYKIKGNITKWIERQVAKKYLPREVVERITKMGGPVAPVNVWMNWTDKGEFDKTNYLKYQNVVLNG